MSRTRYRARFVVEGHRVHEDAVLVVEDDHIVCIEPSDTPHDVDLGRVALVPGLVNAHSHAFQRAIRGRTEYLDALRTEEDFWSWRSLMYRAALSFDPDALEAVSRMAFLEMVLAGITTVGEFHYLHHQPDGAPYEDPNELGHRVIRAARDVGLRIVLLRVAYHRAGFGRPALPQQRRFVEPDVDTFLQRAEALAAHWAPDPLVSVGLAPHSIRAVPREWLGAVGEHARAHDRVVHIHACEQRAEIEQSRAEYGAEPVAVLDDAGLLDARTTRTTLVHGTHLDEEALRRLARARPTICACPSTERNLGDGVLPALHLLLRRVPIALGTDSQATIDPWVEMRLVEYHERLRAERRNVLARAHGVWLGAPDDGRLETADLLWPMGSAHGARSLGLPVGTLTAGAPADFLALDLDDPSLAATSARTLLADLVFSTTPRAVRAAWVAGRPVLTDGRHPLQEEIVSRFREVMAGLRWNTSS